MYNYQELLSDCFLRLHLLEKCGKKLHKLLHRQSLRYRFGLVQEQCHSEQVNPKRFDLYFLFEHRQINNVQGHDYVHKLRAVRSVDFLLFSECKSSSLPELTSHTVCRQRPVTTKSSKHFNCLALFHPIFSKFWKSLPFISKKTASIAEQQYDEQYRKRTLQPFLLLLTWTANIRVRNEH